MKIKPFLFNNRVEMETYVSRVWDYENAIIWKKPQNISYDDLGVYNICGELVGLINTDLSLNGTLEILHFEINHQEKHKGYGTATINHLKNLFDSIHVRIDKDNCPYEFYKKLGFTKQIDTKQGSYLIWDSRR